MALIDQIRAERDQMQIEIARLRLIGRRQQLLISQQRAENRRLRTKRIRLVAGELEDVVEPAVEATKESDMLTTADVAFDGILKSLRTAAIINPDAAKALKAIE